MPRGGYRCKPYADPYVRKKQHAPHDGRRPSRVKPKYSQVTFHHASKNRHTCILKYRLWLGLQKRGRGFRSRFRMAGWTGIS